MIIKSGFRPAWWLRGAHPQTIWPGLRWRNFKIELRRERLELPDGDFIDLVWTPETDGPLVIVLHGLEGSIDSHYAKGIMSALHRKGWQAVLMHFRGCSGAHNRLARGYHSGETGDLEYLINLLQRRFPRKQLAATGYSLGGNVLLKYLGEHRQDSGLSAAVAVSVPFVLSKAADRLMQGTSRIYQSYLLRHIQQRMINKFSNRPDAPFQVSDIPGWNSFHLFDNFVTAPLHGFKNSEEYYRLSSSRQYLNSITTSTLIIHAQNDPFLPPDAIPNESELSDNVTLELADDGGHAGFISGNLPWRPVYWLEERIPGYLSNYLS